MVSIFVFYLKKFCLSQYQEEDILLYFPLKHFFLTLQIATCNPSETHVHGHACVCRVCDRGQNTFSISVSFVISQRWICLDSHILFQPVQILHYLNSSRLNKWEYLVLCTSAILFFQFNLSFLGPLHF